MHEIEGLAALVAGASTAELRTRATALHARLRQQVPRIDAEVRWLERLQAHEASR